MDQLTNPILYTFKLLSSLRSRYLVCRCAINIAVSATLFDRKIFQECGQKLNRMEVGSRLRFFQHHESTEFCLNKIKFFRLSNGSVKNSKHLRPKNKDARKKSTEHGIVLKENGDFSSVVGQFLFLSKCPEPYPTMTILQAELSFQTHTPWMVNSVNYFKKSMLIPHSVSMV